MINIMRKDRDHPPHDAKRDPALWKAVTKDVRKIHGEETEPPQAAKSVKVKVPRREKVALTAPVLPAPSPNAGKIDKGTAARLAKGEMKIDASFDLHGYTVDIAHKNCCSS